MYIDCQEKMKTYNLNYSNLILLTIPKVGSVKGIGEGDNEKLGPCSREIPNTLLAQALPNST